MITRFIRCTNIKYFLFLVMLVFSGESFCADVNQEFLISATVHYESNPLLVENDEESIQKRILVPHYIVSAQDDRNLWSANLFYHIERSSNIDISDDREDPAIKLGWSHELENAKFSTDINAQKASTRETELDDSGIITIDGTRKTESISMNWLQNLSEKYSWEVNGSYSDVSYEKISLIDYTTETVWTRVNYDINETTSTYLEIGATSYAQNNNLNRRDSKNINIGSKLELNDTTEASFRMGVSDTETDSDVKRQTQGDISISHSAERLTTIFSLQRMIAPSGVGGFIKADQFSGRMDYNFSEVDEFDFRLSYRKNYEINENTIRALSISYKKEMGEGWNLIFLTSRKEVDYNLNNAMNNIYSISLGYTL